MKNVDFEVAKFMYLLGYRDECVRYYDGYGILHYFTESNFKMTSAQLNAYFQAPEIFDAIQWLWKKGYRIWYERDVDNKCCPILFMGTKKFKMKTVDTPEEALEVALKFLSGQKLKGQKELAQ